MLDGAEALLQPVEALRKPIERRSIRRSEAAISAHFGELRVHSGIHERRMAPAASLTDGIVDGHDPEVYVVALVVVAAIVNWLVDTALATVTSSVVVPSLQRARRASTDPESGAAYERSFAAAAIVRYILDACAVFAACLYYADNNLPRWPAWAVFGIFLAAFHVPRAVAALGRLVRVRRSAA